MTQPVAIGFDADQDCSHVAALAVERGATFVCRYLKNLSVAEARTLSAAGLSIVSIFESTAQRSLSGGAGGTADGTKALTQARSIGQPSGSAIYFAVDFDATSAQTTVVLAYLAAARAALGGAYKMGAYANGAACQAARNHQLVDYTWLAGGMAMRGSADFAAAGRATMTQDVGDKRGLNLGISIDSDVALTADFGGWQVGVATVAVAPVQTPPLPTHPDPVYGAVYALQTALSVAGEAVGAVDHILGPQTLAATQSYMRKHPLTAADRG
ncbi:MAG TPA: glycoside hydrolase domain-containing protein [Stellaceae bacterium]|jgi:hypothetical protein|nr:glycoside hydrolase domain-containing protein [Stellaceae bacterium]